MIRRILVVRAGALGDVVLTLPAVRALRLRHPEAEIEVAGYPTLWAVAGPLVDRVIDVNGAAFAGLLTGKLLPPLRDLLRGVDLAVVWTVQDRRALFHDAGVSRVVHSTPFPPPGVHAAHWLLDSIGASEEERTAALRAPILSLSPEELAEAREALRGDDLAAPIVIHPGAGADWKRWPAERFAEVANALLQRGEEVAVVEGPADREAVAAMLARLDRAVPVLGEEGLRKLGALLSQAGLFIGGDTGVTHLAGAVGAPTIALFGPTDPVSWAPLGNGRVLRACGASTSRQRQVRVCEDPDCMREIGTEEVLAAVAQARPCRTA